MEVQERFNDYLRIHQLADPAKHRILVGVSGGKDSVLMLYLLVKAGFSVGIAHVHFGLRGADADKDEDLVLEYARTLEVPVYVRHFETEQYARQEGISIQMAARALRYEWFEEFASQLRFDRIAVGQHASDQVETILINQLRGTGIRGWQGMQPRRGKVIRPLLFLTAEEVAKEVQRLGLAYRDDHSNFSVDYVRNRIRLRVVPEMREVQDQLEETFRHNAHTAGQVISFLDEQLEHFRQRWLSRRGDMEVLQMDELRTYQSREFILYELLRPYGFSADTAADINRRTDSFSGQQFFSESHELLLDRQEIWIRPLHQYEVQEQTWLASAMPGELTWEGQRLVASIQPKDQFDPRVFGTETSQQQAFFDADKIHFPLRVRSWREGDRFRPFGMGGKQKKVSDLFTSLKIGLWAKEKVPILEDASGVILWVAPHRQSWEYNICDKTMNVMTISYFCEDGG